MINGIDKMTWTWKQVVHEIEGWLTPVEGMFLFGVASLCTDAIVEIGSWVGKSTIHLAAGSMYGNSVRVYAVDPHTGEGDNSPEFNAARGEDINTLPFFQKHIKLAGVDSVVVPLVMTSEQACKEWNGGDVQLVFIDGDHSWEHVICDCKMWESKLKSGGFLMLHDTRVISHLPMWPGPAAAAQWMRDCGLFKDIGIVDTITYGVKK